MGITETDCPVCGRDGTMKGADPSGRDAVQFECQRACGVFVMDGPFLAYTWPTVPNEDKEAIAVLLEEHERKKGPKVILSTDNYKVYV